MPCDCPTGSKCGDSGRDPGTTRAGICIMWERSHDRRRKDGRGSDGRRRDCRSCLRRRTGSELKMRLLSEPEAIAKEWGVEIGASEAARLRKVGAFAELADEARRTLFRVCDPKVCYPSTCGYIMRC